WTRSQARMKRFVAGISVLPDECGAQVWEPGRGRGGQPGAGGLPAVQGDVVASLEVHELANGGGRVTAGVFLLAGGLVAVDPEYEDSVPGGVGVPADARADLVPAVNRDDDAATSAGDAAGVVAGVAGR